MTKQTEPPDIRIDRAALRRHRQLCGLSQSALAVAANISFSYVGHLERGDREYVSPPVFARLCDALGITGTARDQLMDSPAGAA